MQLRSFAIFSLLSDLLVPPRETERAVRTLTLANMRTLRSLDSGSLPYHDSSARALVWEVKYYANRRATELCGAFLAELLADMATEELGRPLLIPVPMHQARRKARGHNQTELLAESALRYVGDLYDYSLHALVRIVDTSPQQGLSEKKRRTNVQGSMTANKEAVCGRVCVVLDDVSTTGATFAEAARALQKAGARSIHCVALAQS